MERRGWDGRERKRKGLKRETIMQGKMDDSARKTMSEREDDGRKKKERKGRVAKTGIRPTHLTIRTSSTSKEDLAYKGVVGTNAGRRVVDVVRKGAEGSTPEKRKKGVNALRGV
jgi:hypothetical protein